MRHATFASASLLLLGSALAPQHATAQATTPAAPDAVRPTATVTLVADPDAPTQADDAQPAAGPRPTASVTLVPAPPAPPQAPPAPAPQPAAPVIAPTASVTLVPAPPAAPAAAPAPAVQPTASVTLVPVVPAPPAAAPAPDPPAAPVVPPPPAAIAPATASATLPPGMPAAAPAIPAPAAPTADAVIDPATYQKRTEFDNTPWRFNMEQNGRRMTADEFTAWMEARGVRVARGPKPHAPANPTRDGMPAPGSAQPALARAEETLVAAAPVAAPQSPSALAPGSVRPTDTWPGTETEGLPPATAPIAVPIEPLPPASDAGEAR